MQLLVIDFFVAFLGFEIEIWIWRSSDCLAFGGRRLSLDIDDCYCDSESEISQMVMKIVEQGKVK